MFLLRERNFFSYRCGLIQFVCIQREDHVLVDFGTPVLSTSRPMSPGNIACAPELVSNPSQSVMVMSAVDIAIMQLNGRIPCSDNSPAMNISLVQSTTLLLKLWMVLFFPSILWSMFKGAHKQHRQMSTP